jgi:isovaleryl-CoA dehydrogenase
MFDQVNPVFDLGEDLEALRSTVRAFARAEIAPLVTSMDREDRFPAELWPRLGELGLLGITVEEAYGGSALGYLAHVVATEELARCSSAVALSYLAHSNLCVNQIRLNGTPEQKERYLPKLVSGEHIGALAMSESGAGSDVMGMSLRADRVDGGWVLNGSKMWITNGPVADTLVVYGKSDPSAGPRGVTTFIVERAMPGFSIAQKLDKLGNRGSPTGELVFEGCFIPDENVMGGVGGGARVLMSGLDYERVIAAAPAVGVMRSCLDVVLPYVHQRKQFGQPIGSFQLMQGKLADMYARLSASTAYLYSVARACDQAPHGSRGLRKDSAALILFCAENATWMADQSIQCLGGNGYINDYPTGRLWRDAKLYEIGAGTSEIRRWLVGRELFEETGE